MSKLSSEDKIFLDNNLRIHKSINDRFSRTREDIIILKDLSRDELLDLRKFIAALIIKEYTYRDCVNFNPKFFFNSSMLSLDIRYSRLEDLPIDNLDLVFENTLNEFGYYTHYSGVFRDIFGVLAKAAYEFRKEDIEGPIALLVCLLPFKLKPGKRENKKEKKLRKRLEKAFENIECYYLY